MNKNFKDLSGKKFGMLTAIKISNKSVPGRLYWDCVCDCGKIKITAGYKLRGMLTTSCGCIHNRDWHGLRKHPLYRVWASMKNRCYNPSCHNFQNYGGRGIDVCSEWKISFVSFYNDMVVGYKRGLQIDRKNTNKGYFKDNCRWVTPKENSNNRRNNSLITYKGETKTAFEWADEVGVAAKTILSRIKKGWTMDECFDKRLHFK